MLFKATHLSFTMQASLGTTKYCSYFLKSMQCPKPDCMYLHELGDEAASFTKEEMQVKFAPFWTSGLLKKKPVSKADCLLIAGRKASRVRTETFTRALQNEPKFPADIHWDWGEDKKQIRLCAEVWARYFFI